LLALLLGSNVGHFLSLLITSLGQSLALATDGFEWHLLGCSHRGRLGGGAIVLVHTLHVVEKVVATREAVSWDRTITVTEVTKMRSRTMAVHAVGLTFVTEKASSRGELKAKTSLLVATEWLQVRIHVYARIR
jgi:hypothetical protein